MRRGERSAARAFRLLLPWIAAALCAAVAGAQARASAAAQPERDAAVPRLEPSACATETLRAAGASCFTLFVEEDREEPNGTTVELPVAVLEPEEPSESAAIPVIFFPGGPGYSVLDAPELVAQYREDVGARTLVLLDHRGMQHARPALRCPAYAQVSPYHRPLFAPAVAGAPDVRARMASVTDAVEACYAKLAGEGVDVPQYNAWAVARDVEALRRALGVEAIDLYGRSTGGGTALAHLRYFPGSVRSVVLVSPWQASLRNRAAIDELYTAKQRYTDVLALCARESARCRERVPDWLLAVERARSALDARPYVAQVGGEDGTRETLRFDGAAFLHALYLFLPDVYERLPKLVADLGADDRSGLDALFRLDTWTPRSAAPRYALGHFLALVCNDMGAHRPAPADSLRMLDREPALLGFEPPWACAWWGADGDVPPEHNLRPEGPTPVLSLHGEMDACCGVRWGRHLAETLPNTRVVELRGLGHTPDSACGSRLIARFLADPHPPLDTSCAHALPRRPWVVD